jgi:histidinol-phosphate aminotransferase
MLAFIRSDLAEFTAYAVHPEEGEDSAIAPPLDRLDANESPFDLPDDLKQKLGWTLQTLIQSNRYPDGVQLALKRAIADYVTESASTTIQPFTAAHISLGNGSDELIRSLLIATCLGSEGSILVAEPTFSMYGILARTLGIPVVAVGRSPDTFEVDLPAAQAAINQTQQPPIRVVFMVHPNSPTGNSLTAVEIAWLQSLPEHVLVVIDEAYFEFSQTTLAAELPQHPNWVILRTFSKAFRLAAHRMGYAIAHPELIATLEKVRLPYNLPSLSQSAALAALTHRQQLLAVIPELIEQRQQVAAWLAQYPALQVWNSSANFLFVRQRPLPATPNRNLQSILEDLKAEGSLIRYTGNGLRITIGTAAENARLKTRLGAILDRLFSVAGSE